ncbi:FecR domain-containing protein [Maridesulfovibrio sp.]|uniref:FecR domain-containing protein n=1 Tax=Maridesulfovibrio sp. TaxID=2795000 RepID=UPI0039EEEEE1
MPVEQNSAQEIGVVTGVSGDAYAQSASGTRALEPGSPIYQGEELVTGDGGNVEVRFADDTLISQGSNSRIALDDYVYDPDGGSSSFLGDIAQGTFRTVTGKIAEQNPDRFKLGSPLATIGIRGTIILSDVRPDGEVHGVEEIHAGKAMVLQSRATGEIRQLFAGQMSDVSGSGMLSPVRPLSAQELNTFRDIAPANIRQEQEIREQREEEEQQDDQNDENQDQTEDQGGEEQTGEEQGDGEQSQDEQQEEQAAAEGEQQGDQQGEQQGELPGEVDPGGGDPNEDPGTDGGPLHVNKGVLDPGDKGLVGQQRFDPNKISEPPKIVEKPDVQGEGQQQGEQQGEGQEDNSGNLEGDETGTTEKEKQPTSQQTETEQQENEPDKTNDTGDDNSGEDYSGGASSDPHVITGSGLLEGTNEADTITGASSNDTLLGYGGDDVLNGMAGNDTLEGGAGEDVLNGGGGSYNYLDGGSGAADEVDFASFDGQKHGVTVDLSAKNGEGEVTVTTDDGHDVLVNIEGVIGTQYKDTLTGDDNDNRFLPGLNEEYDSLGAESIDGGIGSDWVQFEDLSSEYHVEIDLDPIYGSAEVKDSTATQNSVALKNIENATGSSGNDYIRGSYSINNILKGGDGDDLLDGLSGNNTLYGEQGNDSLVGGDGNDELSGGSGNDSIMGGKGTNIIEGGSGADSLSYDFITTGSAYGIDINYTAEGAGTAVSHDSSDIIDTFTGIEMILGSQVDDIISGSEYGETIDGNKGSDSIQGNGGNDLLSGGLGIDQISGGSGTDSISGGEGNDILYGDGDNDSISGGAGDDEIYGGDGDDVIAGGAGDNHLYGGSSDYGSGFDTVSYADHQQVDIVLSDTTSHTIGGTSYVDDLHNFSNYIGSNGNDSFKGSSADETFTGGKGNDTFNGYEGLNSFSGGEGHDTMSFEDAGTGVTVTVQETGNTTVTHSGTIDIFSDVESFIGSSHDDSFIGSSRSETFRGGNGNDTIDGGNGEGIDYASYFGSSTGVSVKLNGSSAATTDTGDTITNIEGLIGSGYQDNLEGDDYANYFRPGLNDPYVEDAYDSDAEIVTGNGGSDWILFDDLASQYYIYADINNGYVSICEGETEKNKITLNSIENLVGTSGSDIITGGTEGNTLDGGAGDDIISGGWGENSIDGGAGSDQLSYAFANSGITVNLTSSGGTVSHMDSGNTEEQTDTIANIESFMGSIHDDTFNGSSGNETFIGGKGNDVMDGHGGHDTIDFSDFETGVTITVATDGTGTATRTVDGTSETDSFNDIDNFLGSWVADTFIGGSGDIDQTFQGNSGIDSVDGGGGTDFVSFANKLSGITIDLADNADGVTKTVSSGANLTFTNIEGVIGSRSADCITASTVGESTIQGGGGADSITLGHDDGLSTKISYTSLSDGGDFINYFENTNPTEALNDKLLFSGSDFDSNAGFETYSAGAYTGDADAGTTEAYFVFDNNNQLWYDSNGDASGGETLIAHMTNSDPLTADDIEVSS